MPSKLGSVIARHEVDEQLCKLRKLSKASEQFRPEMNAIHHTMADQARALHAQEWQLICVRRKVHAKMTAEMTAGLEEGEIVE